MSRQKVFFAALLGLCCTWGTATAQEPNPPPTAPAAPEKEGAPAQPKAESTDQGGTGLSSWITYDRDNCCIGTGGGMPILTEVIFRIGPSFPIGGEFFGRNLDTGWMIAGGARAMFFNPALSRAWAVELSVSNTYNASHSTNTVFLNHPLPNGTTPGTSHIVSVRALDRTFANAAIGREWYVWAPAIGEMEGRLRLGTDFGGRYGAGTVKFNEIRHRTQVIEGVFAAIHADLEIPYGRCTYLGGVRGEYGFTWSNIFAPGRGDMQDLTLLFNLGVRY